MTGMTGMSNKEKNKKRGEGICGNLKNISICWLITLTFVIRRIFQREKCLYLNWQDAQHNSAHFPPGSREQSIRM